MIKCQAAASLSTFFVVVFLQPMLRHKTTANVCVQGADPNSKQNKNNSSVYLDGFRDYTVVMGVVISPLTHSVQQSSHNASHSGGDGGGIINTQQETKVRKV